MRCPWCNSAQAGVVNTQKIDGGRGRQRRYKCRACGRQFVTVERPVMPKKKETGE